MRWMVAVLLAAMTGIVWGAPKEEIKAIADREFPALEKIYMGVHQAPELSLMEEKTAAFLAGELRKAGYEVTETCGGYGIVGVLKNGEGKTLIIRTDLDALPVKEETQAQYASAVMTKDMAGQVVPVMHACGHDVHITTMVGVARTMAELKKNWKGTLILIGQPAEEVSQGAKRMMADGLFKKWPRPDYAIALHVDAELEVGKVGYISGYAMANVDSIDIADSRDGRAWGDAAYDQGSDRDRGRVRAGAADDRQPRGEGDRAGGGDGGLDSWRNQAQHHSG
jgi:metal-dependent amidase/aminoacylase/carboxypeptidase family protein